MQHMLRGSAVRCHVRLTGVGSSTRQHSCTVNPKRDFLSHSPCHSHGKNCSNWWSRGLPVSSGQHVHEPLLRKMCSFTACGWLRLQFSAAMTSIPIFFLSSGYGQQQQQPGYPQPQQHQQQPSAGYPGQSPSPAPQHPNPAAQQGGYPAQQQQYSQQYPATSTTQPGYPQVRAMSSAHKQHRTTSKQRCDFEIISRFAHTLQFSREHSALP